jgi:hypothetical protein
MKTEKETAKEFIEKFLFEVKDSMSRDGGNLMFLSEAKECALIMVDEIDLLIQRLTPIDDQYMYLQVLEHYQGVKKEIINYENES